MTDRPVVVCGEGRVVATYADEAAYDAAVRQELAERVARALLAEQESTAVWRWDLTDEDLVRAAVWPIGGRSQDPVTRSALDAMLEQRREWLAAAIAMAARTIELAARFGGFSAHGYPEKLNDGGGDDGAGV